MTTPRRPPTTEEQKAQVRVLHQRGVTVRKIATELDLSSSTVHNIIGNSALRPARKTPQAKAAERVFNRHAPADFSHAIVTRHTFAAGPDAPICNAASTALYRGAELHHRSMR